MKKTKWLLPILVVTTIVMIDVINFIGVDKEKIKTYFGFKDSISSIQNMGLKDFFVDVTGYTLKTLDSRMFFMNEGIFITRDNNTVNRYSYADLEFETAQMIYLKEYLDIYGINLIYVNAPVKYTDDEYFRNEFGISSYANENADRFVDNLRAEGINVIDLREDLLTDNQESLDAFYRTDHHWKIETGIDVAKLITEQVHGETEHGRLDDPDCLFVDYYNNVFVGEQGQKVSDKYIGVEDFKVYLPSYDIDYNFILQGNAWKGCFTDMMVKADEGSYGGGVGYYSYMGPNINDFHLINNDIKDGKVVILGDSLANAVAPFLSLDVNQVSIFNPREIVNNGGNLMDSILSTECDTLVIMYSEGVLGAYDRGDTSNWPMFYFYTGE